MRDSPAVDVARRLLDLGAEVLAVEPYAEAHHIPDGVALVELTERGSGPPTRWWWSPTTTASTTTW